MPRPVKIASRYKAALAGLTACDPAERENWRSLLLELQGLCEAVDQTAERLYRLERVLLTWSGTARGDVSKLLGGDALPVDGASLPAAVHRAMTEGVANGDG